MGFRSLIIEKDVRHTTISIALLSGFKYGGLTEKVLGELQAG